MSGGASLPLESGRVQGPLREAVVPRMLTGVLRSPEPALAPGAFEAHSDSRARWQRTPLLKARNALSAR